MRPDRTLLRVGATSLMGLWLLTAAPLLAQDMTFGEAPELAARVAAGQLPPVAERLPANPQIMDAAEIGTYGGMLRLNGISGSHWPLLYTAGAELFFRFDNETNPVPALVESYEVNDDATEYVIKLRAGVKWSDGAPYTVDDILFWFEDIALNEEFNPGYGLNGWFGGLPPIFRSNIDGKTVPPTLEKIDDITLRITYAVPNGTFVIGAASSEANGPTRLPKHYLQHFHPAYNPDVQALAEAEGFPNWPALMRAKMDWWANPEVPVLHAWKLEEGFGDSSIVEAVRNPYYWKVDADGNQLPYIDRVRWTSVEDKEVGLLQTLSGEVDLLFQSPLTSADNQALFTDNAERGGYRLVTVSASPVVTSFDLNLTVEDPVKRAVFRDKNFRIGLSHAMNREEISDLVYLGVKVPAQFAPTPGSPLYDEEFASQFIEHDIDLANRFLDMVLPEKDAQGFRLGPDGNRFSFVLETHANAPDRVMTLELMQRHFAAVGIDTDISTLDGNLLTQKRSTNDFDSHLGITTTGSLAAVLNFNPFPIYTWPNNDEYNGTLWSNWYLGLVPSEVPPEGVQRGLARMADMRATPVTAEQIAAGLEMMKESRELFITMGTVREGDGYAIANAKLANIPEPIFPQYFAPGTVDPESWFYRN